MKPNNEEYLVPIRQALRACRKCRNKMKFADSTGMQVTGGKTLLLSIIFRRLLRRYLGTDEQNVGVLMPTSVYGAIVNLALALDRRTSVNLNYTFGVDTIDYCTKNAGIKHVITSRKVLEQEKFKNVKLDAEFLVLEDLGKGITLLDKIIGFIDGYITPVSIYERVIGLTKIQQDDILTIFFTSGSTGTPKGAAITQRCIAANVAGFSERLALIPEDILLGALPFFHSFGFTTTIWLPATKELSSVFHFNPLDPKKVGEMVQKYCCTAMPTTPTFLRGYLRRCSEEEFESMDTIICGAEKLPLDLIDAWEQKFGIRPTEGYGTTELSPVVSVGGPKAKRTDYQDFLREGSIGRPLFNLSVRITDPETGEVLPIDTPGMLEVKGPSVMKGYYNDPEKTAAVLKDGWYSTGDIATVDKDGFIWITGRLSRISKIGGEMVPHILVEEEIEKIVRSAAANVSETDTESNEILAAVSAVPEEKKGEKLVVLHREISITPEEICRLLQNAGLPNLWIPSPSEFYQVDSLPLLGTGKLDLKSIKEMAEEKTGRKS
ncbi:MAG: AMP-binding protein [Planctomycetaceae bacterium]|nr:AMP-binding protein [Planctomycetaceae bacterium]